MSKGIKESYDYYKARVEDPLVSPRYRAIINEFNTFLMKQVLDGNEVILPSRMGRISILGVEQNIKVDEKGNIQGTRIDWFSTKGLWATDPEHAKKKTLVYFFNEHSDGIRYSFKWFKNRIFVLNKNYYTFVPSRQNKRLLAKLIKNGFEYFIK